MRQYLLISACISFTIYLQAQNLEVDGKAKITEMVTDNSIDSIIVKLADGTLGIRDANTITQFQLLSISNDTIFLSGGGFVKLPPDMVNDSDSDPSNEVQNLAISLDSLEISGGNKVDLSAYKEGWTMENDTTFTMKKVGIGISAPDENLHVAGHIKMVDGNEALGKVLASDANGVGSWQTVTGLGTGGWIENIDTTSTALNVGIGTSNPTEKLEVNGNILALTTYVGSIGTTLNGITHHSSDTTNYALAQTSSGDNTFINKSSGNGVIGFRVANVDQLVIDQDGMVGIGTSAPLYDLHVMGKIKSDGFTESSDLRFKQKVTTLSHALDKVLALNGVSYQWKYDDVQFSGRGFDQRTHVGFVAQEVEQIIPEVVDTDSEGFKSVQYAHVVPVLVEAIKEQQEIINALTQKVEVLTEVIQKERMLAHRKE